MRPDLRNIFIILGMLLLCSCEHFEEDKEAVSVQAEKDARDIKTNVTTNATRVADNVRDSIKNTGEHIRQWWITPLPSKARQPMPPRYCYRALQDILCYRQPMPGWESRIVGYQGTGAKPPKAATMRPYPLRPDDKDALPANRAANLKPVFADIPEDVKDPKKAEGTITIDTTHEALPDSALAPQL